MDSLELVIDNQVWDGWQTVTVVRSIKQVANTFSLSLTDRWQLNSAARPIRSDAACQIRVGGEVVITGYVFEVVPGYESDSHVLSVSGLSKAADLVDCSINGQQWSNRTLAQIAGELVQPFGIGVSVETDIGAPFSRVAIESGQTIYSFLEELARIRGVRLISKENGDIAIIRSGLSQISTGLVLGKNILKGSGLFSSSHRFSSTTVVGQSAGSDEWNGEQAAHVAASVAGQSIRYRPTTVIADGPANSGDAKNRAQAEKNRQDGESLNLTYRVQGWYHETGLWSPNQRVSVKDSLMNINNTLLISEVRYGMGDQGSFCDIELSPINAFDLLPQPEPAANNEGW